MGENWVKSAEIKDDRFLRGIAFETLRGVGIEDIPIEDRFSRSNADSGSSGGRETNPISVTSTGTGLSRQGKTPRYL